MSQASRLSEAEALQAELERGLAGVRSIDLDRLDGPERDEAITHLQELKHAFDQNPLLAFMPHPKQRQMLASWDRLRAYVGGNRSGKTMGGVADDLIQALDADLVPPHLRPYKRVEPPFRCRIFTPDLGSTMENIHETIRRLAPPSALRGGSWEKAYAKADRILRFQNGSLFDFFSYDQDLDQMGSVSRSRIHYDEEPPEAVRYQSRKRIIDTGGDELFSFTPELGIGWTHDAIFMRRGEEGITVVRAGMADNPVIPPAEIEAIQNDPGLSEDEKKITLYGDYVAIGGTFYSEFGDDHLVDPPTPEHLKGQTILVGIDPGLNRPGMVWVAFDNEESALVFDELIPKQMTVADQAKAIKAKNALWGVKPHYVIDPSARNRATVNADAVEAGFARAGIYCEHGQNDRAAGIMEVKRRLQAKTLLVSRDCHELRWEFPRYQKKVDAPSEFDAVKVNDDLLDALRYALLARAWARPQTPPRRREAKPWNYVGPWRPARQESPPLGTYS